MAGAVRADETPDPPVEARAQQFVRVSGAQNETVAAGPLLVGAYATIWLLLMGYLVSVGRKQSRVRRDIARLERMLENSQAQKPEPKA